MDRLVRAVVTGLAVGLAGAIFARFVLGIVIGLVLMSVGAAPNDQTLSFPPFTSSPPEFLGFIVEFAFSMLGGFVAGKRYPPAPMRAGLYVGFATCAAVLLRIALADIRSAPVGPVALECAAALLAACLGGALAMIADEDLHRHAMENIAQADALLLGRATYEMMEAAWRSPRSGAMPDWTEPFARTIDTAKKYVVSSTLDRVDWNAELLRGDLGKGRSAAQTGVRQGTGRWRREAPDGVGGAGIDR